SLHPPRVGAGLAAAATLSRAGGGSAHERRAAWRPDRNAQHRRARAQHDRLHTRAGVRSEPETGKDLARPHHRFHRGLRAAIFWIAMPLQPAGTIRVRFFARYAELVGRAEAAVAVPLPATVGDVVRSVRAR